VRHADATSFPGPLPVAGKGERLASGRLAMSLRLKINIVFAAVGVLLLAVLALVAVQSARSSVREEIDASNRIATQLLERVVRLHALGGLDGLAGFLADTGRIRANDIALFDDAGALLYASPPSRYKAGRDAPAWYAALVTPALTAKVISLPGARLVIAPNPSRSVLDAWDELRRIFMVEALVLLTADLAIFWMVGRWLAPLVLIQRGLRDIAQGHHHARLPPLPGKEAGGLGRTFNNMAQAVEENLEAKKTSLEAQARLAAQREFTALLQARIEEERAALARELHDEFGQSLTAIRSIAKSLVQHAALQGSPMQGAAQILYDTAGSSADALQRMIPRLRPVQLEGMGLGDALRDLVAELRLHQALQADQSSAAAGPALRYDLVLETVLPALPEGVEMTAYRIAQEALTNVARHSGASVAVLRAGVADGILRMTVSDNGPGDALAASKDGALELARHGHYGIPGMCERAQGLGGSMAFRRSPQGGLEVELILPLAKETA
jgi:two-component system sensor histidine kinase UhpB